MNPTYRFIARVSVPELRFDKYVAFEVETPITQEIFDEVMEQTKNAMCLGFRDLGLGLGN